MKLFIPLATALLLATSALAGSSASDYLKKPDSWYATPEAADALVGGSWDTRDADSADEGVCGTTSQVQMRLP